MINDINFSFKRNRYKKVNYNQKTKKIESFVSGILGNPTLFDFNKYIEAYKMKILAKTAVTDNPTPGTFKFHPRLKSGVSKMYIIKFYIIIIYVYPELPILERHVIKIYFYQFLISRKK